MAVRKTRTLTEGSIVGTLLLYMIPILLSNLFQQLYNTVDSIVVGRFSGDLALAAVGSSGALINLMIGFFLGLATGSGVIFAMNYGAKNYTELRKVMDNAVILGLIIGGMISVCGVLFSDNLLTLMNTPATVFPLAKRYLPDTSHRLGDLLRHFGLPCRGTHRCQFDCENLLLVYRKLIEFASET